MHHGRITNPKVESLRPTWRRFRGLSVIFDSPDPAPLFDRLAALVDRFAAAELRDRYGWCPLPRDTFHVTVCDGPNDANLADLDDEVRVAVETVLARPELTAALPPELAFLDPSALHAVGPLALRPMQLVVGNTVLMARLVPVDDAGWRGAVRARATYADRLATNGLQTQPWHPHVSLGYFADQAGAAAARSALVMSADGFEAIPPIEFHSLALYRFTDMATYERWL